MISRRSLFASLIAAPVAVALAKVASLRKPSGNFAKLGLVEEKTFGTNPPITHTLPAEGNGMSYTFHVKEGEWVRVEARPGVPYKIVATTDSELDTSTWRVGKMGHVAVPKGRP